MNIAFAALLLSVTLSASAAQDNKSDPLITEGASLTPLFWRIPEKSVPAHTKGKREASVMLGSRSLVCYGQMKHVQYTTVKSMPKKWGRTASAGAQPGFITTAEAAF